MNSFQLFFRRLMSDWNYQFRAIRSIADWTIILYIAIPSAVIFSFLYRSWWMETPAWVQWAPLNIAFLLGYLFAWYGNYRTFVEEADKIFLIRKQRLFLNIKKWGFIYSLLLQAHMTCLFILFMLPFLIQHYKLSFFHVFLFFLYVLVMKYLIMYIKFHIQKVEGKTWRIVITILIFILLNGFVQLVFIPLLISHSVIGLIITMAIGVIAIFLYYPKIKNSHLFELVLSMEMQQRLKRVNMIFQLSMDIEKTTVSTRKKPWLFRKSKIIFKERTPAKGFIELFIKVFIRNSMYILTYLQIISVTGAALIIVPPLWIKVIIFTGYLFMIYVWLGITWERITIGHPLVKKYCEMEGFFRARRVMKNGLFFLSIILVGSLVAVGTGLYHLFSI